MSLGHHDAEHHPRSVVDAGEIRQHAADRLAGFAVMLPANPGGLVGLATSPEQATVLSRVWPESVVLEPDQAQGPFALIVADERHEPEDLTDLLAPEGVLALVGESGDVLVYPDAARPELLHRPGWPVPARPGRLGGVRRRLGLARTRLRGGDRLSVVGPASPSFADRVVADVSAQLGEPLGLVGVLTAGHVVLRLRGVDRDVAVRLSLTDPGSEVMAGTRMVAEVPGLAGLVPEELARGDVGGRPWVATPWIGSARPQRRATARALRADAADRAIAALSAAPTGQTGPGWSARLLERTPLLDEPTLASLADALALLDDEPVPTGWCHGDLWEANVLLGADGARVIDWDSADPDVPLGIDHVLAAALARVLEDGELMAAACARLVEEPTLLEEREVGGRAWSTWDRTHRAALAAVAVTIYLRNQWDAQLGEGLEGNRARLRALLSGEATTPTAPTPRTGRGALWLALGGTSVKAAQTAILLVLAAILEPAALGVIAVGSLIVNVSTALTDVGTCTALVYWRGNAERAARTALTLALSLSAGAAALAWLLAPWLAAVLNTGDDGVFVIRGLTLVLPCYAIANVSKELLRREFAFARRVVPDIAAAVACVGVSLWLAFTDHGVAAMVYGQITFAVVAMVLCWVVRTPVRPGWSGEDARGLLAFGKHLAAGNVVELLMLNVDYVIVARVLGAAALGQYSLAFRLGYMPYLIVAVALLGAAFPALCRLDGREVGRAAGRTAVTTLTLTTPLYAGMLLLAPQLTLLGDQWQPAVPVLRWLAVYGLALTVLRCCDVALRSVGRTRETLAVKAVHLLLLTAVLLVLAPHGVALVGVGQAVAVVLVWALAFTLVGRYVPGMRVGEVLRGLAPALVGALAMALVVLLLNHLLPWTVVSVGGLLLVGPLALLAYAGPVVLLRGRRS